MGDLKTKIIQYADYASPVYAVKSSQWRNQVSDSLNHNLSGSSVVSDIKLYSSKTKTLPISRTHTIVPTHPPFYIGNTLLDEYESLTKLVITFHSHLFEKHLMNGSAHAARKLGMACNASHIYNNDKINVTGFKSFVLILLEYCSPAAQETHAAPEEEYHDNV